MADCLGESGLTMHFVGTVLVIAGLGLCISILWADIGFIALLLGLICLLIDEEQARRLRKLASSAVVKAEELKTQASKTPAFQTRARKQTPALLLVSPASALPRARDGTPPLPLEQNDQQKLIKAPCENEPDTAHSAFEDKDFLPSALQKAVTSVRKLSLETFIEPSFEMVTARPRSSTVVR
jgi:hypothetical protein